MASSRPDLEALLQDGNIIRIRPQGYSMYPLFIPGRDEALIESVSADTVRKNDVVLYRRDQSILAPHRICKTLRRDSLWSETINLKSKVRCVPTRSKAA